MSKTLIIIIGIIYAVIAAAGCSPSPQKETPQQTPVKTTHYRDKEYLLELDKGKIIVVRNDLCDANIRKTKEKTSNLSREQLFDYNYDHVQDVLNKLGIPHTLIGKSELEKDDYSLDDKWAILFNCNDSRQHCCNRNHILDGKRGDHVRHCEGEGHHIFHETKLNEKTMQKIKRFVETGGYLFTEDLNIEEIYSWYSSPRSVFRGIIANTKYIQEQEVEILPSRNAEKHPYLKYVFELPAQPDTKIKWKIDGDSPNIKIIDKEVTALIVSPQLKKEKEGQVIDEGIMAVTSSVLNKVTGKPGGQVLHVMSHFDRQTSNAGEFALTNLLINFLEECAQRHSKKNK